MPIGKSERIKEKAFIKFQNKFLFLHGYEILQKIFPTYIICHPEVEKRIENLKNVIIDTLNVGPLGALYIAGKNLCCDYIFFAGCDMPFLNEDVIKFMCKYIEKGKGVVLKREKFEPLHAIYERDFILDTVRDAIECSNLKISKIIEENLDKFNVIDVYENFKDDKFLYDIDTVEDICKLNLTNNLLK